MATPPTITGLEPEEVQGDVMRMLPILEKALRASAACLGKGLTLRDNVQAYVREVTFTAPDDWVPVTLINGFTQVGGAPQFGTPAVRKTEDGEVDTRGFVERAAGAPPVGTAIYTLTGALATYAPTSIGDRRFIVEGGGATPTFVEITPANGLVWNGGATTFINIGALRWVATDRRPVPWADPLTLDCEVPWKPAYVRVLSLAYSGERTRRTTGAGPVLWREVQQTKPGVRRIEIQRIMGLAPTQKYNLLLGVFPE